MASAADHSAHAAVEGLGLASGAAWTFTPKTKGKSEQPLGPDLPRIGPGLVKAH